MYTDFTLKSRDSWKLGMTGKSLFGYAKALLTDFQIEEGELREYLAAMMRDLNQPIKSEEISKKQKRLEFVAAEVEKLKVWNLMFDREGDRVFPLEIGDVVYFRIV